MPRIKRWFPVSHDILDDPETIELAKTFGDRAVFMWLRMLSWGDRNAGKLGSEDQIAKTFGRCFDPAHPNRAATQAAPALRWMLTHAWVTVRSGVIYITKYAKYHRDGETEIIPPDQPDQPSDSFKKKNPVLRASPGPSQAKKKEGERESGNGKLDESIKIWADAIYETDPVKFGRLVVWIKAAERSYSVPVVASALQRFLPRASEVQEWWGYLDKILDKEEGKANGSESEARSERIKREEREWLKTR